MNTTHTPNRLKSAHGPIDPLPRDAPIHVAGHKGLAGRAIWRHLEERGHTALLGCPSNELDLRDREAVFDYYEQFKPEYVIMAAAKVGGIMANSQYPADFLSDNLRIQVNILDAARTMAVRRLLFLGSSCIYPKFASQPISEDSLLTGALEPTNDAYAIAKIAGVLQVQALRRQYGVSYISAMPTNLYGPGDNFDLETSHVLPALMRKFSDAKLEGHDDVVLWGSGLARREFLYVDDLAKACVLLLERYDDPLPINVGVGTDIRIRDLATMLSRVTGYAGGIKWDAGMPDGTPRKLLDVSRMQSLGWKAGVGLDEGVETTYRWYQEHALVKPRQHVGRT